MTNIPKMNKRVIGNRSHKWAKKIVLVYSIILAMCIGYGNTVVNSLLRRV